MNSLLTRKEAIANGSLYYFTGKPCKHGHISKRKTSDWVCYECCKIQTRKHANANKEIIREKDKEYKIKNKARFAEYNKKYNADYYEKEKGTDRYRKYGAKWRKANPHKKLADTRKRQANKINATPAWYEKEQVEQLYEQSRQISNSTGIPHHVDHIIPLMNDRACGLHCIDNLQILTAKQNLEKGNAL